jgi:hypothetical protein
VRHEIASAPITTNFFVNEVMEMSCSNDQCRQDCSLQSTGVEHYRWQCGTDQHGSGEPRSAASVVAEKVGDAADAVKDAIAWWSISR